MKTRSGKTTPSVSIENKRKPNDSTPRRRSLRTTPSKAGMASKKSSRLNTPNAKLDTVQSSPIKTPRSLKRSPRLNKWLLRDQLGEITNKGIEIDNITPLKIRGKLKKSKCEIRLDSSDEYSEDSIDKDFNDESVSDESESMTEPIVECKPLKTRRQSPKKIMAIQLAKRRNCASPETELDNVSRKLHISAEPLSLPCREDEFEELYSHIASALEERTGTYVSGVPGTGKTATFRAVLRALYAEKDIEPFDFVEINGMKVTEPKEAYTAFWAGLTGTRVTAAHAEHLLTARFTTKDKKRKTCLVLMDELDLLVNRKQSVVYNFFDWPNLPYSRLIVVAIANTMDLPERMLSNKVSSRLGLTRMVFEPYKYMQLVKIVESRIQGLNAFDEKAIEFCARRVSQVSGDARRCLDVCRRAVEIFAEDENKGEFISTEHINSAIKEMNSSKTAITVKHFSLHKQVFLLACLMSIRKNGTSETNFGAVADEHRSLCGLARLLYPTIPMLYSLCGSLADSRLIIAENQRGGTPQQKIKLNCDENDIIAGIRQSTNHTKLKSVIKRY